MVLISFVIFESMPGFPVVSNLLILFVNFKPHHFLSKFYQLGW